MACRWHLDSRRLQRRLPGAVDCNMDERTFMAAAGKLKKDWTLTGEALESLLDLLDADRERAAERYEELRQTLIRFLGCFGSFHPEDHADEAIDRVARRISEGVKLDPNPIGYFVNVAKNVWREDRDAQARTREFTDNLQTSYDPRAIERNEAAEAAATRVRECLRRCLAKLPSERRALICDYYVGARREQIDHRNRLAAKLNLKQEALRLKAHRLRMKLEACVNECCREAQSA